MDPASMVLTIVAAATPLLLAATGELVTEKSGVLNLGVEGMMLVGAVTAFAAAVSSGSPVAGFAAGAGAGAAMAAIFAALTLGLQANQVATGLALTIFGVSLSAMFGAPFVGQALSPIPRLEVPVLGEVPLVGPVLFGHDAMVYLSLLILAGVALFLYRTRAGLVIQAVGEAPDAAHALGYRVLRIRTCACLFGGAMAGLAGSYLCLAYTPMWAENMTAGRGWIALALVVFATWRPGRLLLGAYLFGAVTILQLYAQGRGVEVASQFMSMLPYLATILVLVLISRDRTRMLLNAPRSIGTAFLPPR
ncbi:MAG: ABC transporter permease [Alphaproteobacteria bacterium]|nr:ABC transporter permease [Alphaproteobacteria bacterium]